jgi:RNA polymerase sigma factor (sigma-70 family)
MADGGLRTVMRCVRRLAERDGEQCSDAELLTRFVAGGDGAAFELLLWRHGPMVLGVCRRLLRCAHDADDAFQATFLALVRKAGSIGRGDALPAWLHRTAQRAALHARAAASRRPESLPENAALEAPDAASDLEWRDLRPVLDEELNRLPDKYRSLIVLCYLQGKTQEEAARLLGCPKGTVAVRLSRARQRLQDRLTRRGVTLGLTATGGSLAAHASAAPPSALIDATLRTTLPGATGAVPAAVAALVKGVTTNMVPAKLFLISAALLVGGVVGGSVGWSYAPREATSQAERAEGEKAKVPEERFPSVVSDCEGKLLFLATEFKPGEAVPEGKELALKLADGKVYAQEIRFLAVEVGAGESVPKGEEVIVLNSDGKPDGRRYRRWKTGDKLDAGKLKVCKERKLYRRLEVGDRIQKGDLVAVIDSALVVEELVVRIAKLDAAAADEGAAIKTRDEAERRFYRDRALRTRVATAISEDELRASELTWQRFAEEVKARDAGVVVAQANLRKELTILRQHEVRSSLDGVVRVIDKHPGEAVKALESVLRLKLSAK